MNQGAIPIAEPFEPFSIRYEGKDAARHEIDLSQLGVSLQGFARILAVCAHFAQTGKYNKQYDALSVKVYAAPVQEHHCYEVLAAIKSVLQTKELWSGTGGVVLTLLVQYVLGRRKEEEMRHLSDALKQSLGQNAETNAKLLSTIERMADALRPAAKQAVQPIGASCETIALASGHNKVVLDQATKDRFSGQDGNAIEPTRGYVGIISEMDMETGNCRVTLDGDESGARIPASITDPIGRVAMNPYVTAMANIRPLGFQAKAEIDSDGNVVRLYISDLSS